MRPFVECSSALPRAPSLLGGEGRMGGMGMGKRSRWTLGMAGGLTLALGLGCGGPPPSEVVARAQQATGQAGVVVIPAVPLPWSWHPEGPVVNVGPWPTDAQLDYSAAYDLPALKSVSLDDAYNLWMLDRSNRIGVLPAGETTVQWASGLGQAGRGFATTVVCGGAENQAYVGYWADDNPEPYSATPNRPTDPSDGDADVVQLDPDGQVSLTQHLNIFNSNDHHYNETMRVLACAKVMRGPLKGDLYFATNHAVTRVRGLEYSDHRHSVWSEKPGGSLMIGYDWAVSITPRGDVLFANDWKVAMLTPMPPLQSWIDFTATPWKLDTFIPGAGSLADFDYWRATAQTQDGTDYFGSKDKGLWRMYAPSRFEKVPGLPTDGIAALAGTDDGALYIGTTGGGLWRMEADHTLTPVDSVPGNNVLQLFYDPTVTPSMLLVLTNAGLTVLRGP